MNITVKDTGDCRKELHVSVDAEAVSEEYSKIVADVSKVAKVRGFRPGKVPLDVIETNYSENITEEAKERLVPRFYREALDQEGIKPVAIVGVTDVSFAKEQGIAFNVTVDVAPQFKIPKYKKISLKRKQEPVEDKDVEASFARLLEAGGKYEDVTGRVVQAGDLVLLDYTGTSDGKPLKDLAPDCSGLGDAEDFWAMVGEPEFLPGFAKALPGMAADEEKEIAVHFPDDYHVTQVAGKDATYQVKLKAIRERKLPEVDEAFLKPFDVGSEKELRDKIREDLDANAERQEDARLKEEIAKHLMNKTSFEIPQSIVEQETNATARNMVQRMAMNGASREQIEGQRDEILSQATQSSTERVRISYILERIADIESISVEDAEVEERLQTMARSYQMTVDQLKGELDKRNGTEGIRDELRSEKTLSFLLENAKVK